ncbi:unnamed protein product [Haemonchus placei]|uniref:Uncharacterized protein n=1 Tax=Haemonchus placei TaxID=6290 RepID=A0A0N4WV62_HAEPC|nr:unnamed protein product [Haemonchus placei]
MLTILVICLLFQLFSTSYGCMSMTPTPDTSLARSPNRNPDETHSSAQNWRSQAIVHVPARLSTSKSQLLKPPPPRPKSLHARLFTRDPYAGKRQRSRALAPSQSSLASKALIAEDKVVLAKVSAVPLSKPDEMLSDWATSEARKNSTHNQDLIDSDEASGQQTSFMEQTEMTTLPENPMDDHQQNICELCPPLFMKVLDKSREDKHYCLNWKSIKESFNIVASSTLPRVHDLNTTVACTRIVTCEEPFVLVRWHNSTICDMHSLSYGLDSKLPSSFSYKCNGTSWSLHNFPIDSIACASKVLP